MNCEKLAESFNSYFRVIYANTDELLRQVYKIRYDVFCAELKLEENCPKDVEKDESDAFSYHFLLQHKPSGEYAGTVRFVIPPPGSTNCLLPFERYCLHAFDKNIIDPSKLVTGTYGEVSRLAVAAQFRKRAGERNKPYAIDDCKSGTTEEGKRLFPFISVGLYLTCAALFVHKQIEHAFVMVEPRLARNMARIGIQFEQAGEIIKYHGRRAPFYITQEMLAEHLKPEVKELFDLIRNEIEGQLPPESTDIQRIAV